MWKFVDTIFADAALSTLRTIGQTPDAELQEALKGVAIDRHLENLIKDPPRTSRGRQRMKSCIILKPLSQLIQELAEGEPGTKAYATAHCKKPSKKKGTTEPEAKEEPEVETDPKSAKKKPKTLKDKWTGTPEELRSHLNQVWSFNLAQQMFEEEGKRDQGSSPSLRYFTTEDAHGVMALSHGKQHAAWEAGLERPDKDHLDLIVSDCTGKVKIKWAYYHIHLIISDWKPVIQDLAAKKPVEQVTPKLKAAMEPSAEGESPVKPKAAAKDRNPVKVKAAKSPAKLTLELITKDGDGKELPPGKRYFCFSETPDPAARMKPLGFRKALTFLDQPNAEWMLGRADLSAIPQAFIDASKPWTMVEVINEARRLWPEGSKPVAKERRKPVEQREMEELAQILINLEPSITPKELAARLQHLMGYLDTAVAQAEEWEKANGRDKNGKIRQRWEKGKSRKE